MKEASRTNPGLYGRLSWLFALFLLLGQLPMLPGCALNEEDQAVSGAQKAPEKTQRQAACTEGCVVGTKGCDDDGNVRMCVADGDGCGVLSDLVQQECGSDHWCYLGNCTPVDDEPLPEIMDTSDPSLFELTGLPVSLPADVTVIPYSAFLNALRYDSHFQEASGPEPVNTGIELATIANDPVTYGVTVEWEMAEEFQGDLFLVMMDAARSHIRDDVLESKRYFFAALPGLAGSTDWIGKTAQFATDGAPGGAGCCNTSSMAFPADDIFCGAKPIPLPIPVPVCPGSGNASCPNPMAAQPGLQGKLRFWEDLPQVFRDSVLGGQIVRDPDGLTPQVQLRGNGMHMIGLLDSFDRDHHEALAQTSQPGEHGHVESQQLNLRFHGMTSCQKCEEILCDPVNPPGSHDDLVKPGPSNECGAPSKGSGGRDHCHAMMTSPGDQMCQGGCTGPCLGGKGAIPGSRCNSSTPGGAMHGNGTGSLSVGMCGSSGVPEYCKYATGDASTAGRCGATDFQRQKMAKLWAGMLGCNGLSGQGPSSGVTCTAGGACMQVSTGGSVCFECGAGGDCTERIFSGDRLSRYFISSSSSTSPSSILSDDACRVGASSGSLNQTCSDENPNSTHKNEEQEKVPATDPDPPKNRDATTEAFTSDVSHIKDIRDEENACSTAMSTSACASAPTEGQKDKQVDRPKSEVKTPAENEAKIGVPEAPKQGGDPVLLASGSLDIDHADLVVPGPVRPLSFERSYNSQSDQRSILGSNWSHTYSERLVAITPGNYPTWAPQYCISSYPMTTCVILHGQDTTQTLFIRNPGDTNELFYPSAGSTDTVRRYHDGWMLKGADGHTKIFSPYGSLIQDKDRFGNGVEIEYELTPVGRVFQHHCHALSRGNTSINKKELVLVDESMSLGTVSLAAVKLTYNSQFDERYCRVMASILDQEAPTRIGLEGWSPKKTRSGIAGLRINAPAQSAFSGSVLGRLDTLLPLADDGKVVAKRPAFDQEDADYGTFLLGLDAQPNVPTGDLRERPTKVTDNLGRTLRFSYYGDPTNPVTYGLLHSVEGPAQSTRIAFSYDRPQGHPARLNESFLTGVTRVDFKPTDSTWKYKLPRTITFDYQWPTQTANTYTSHADAVEAAYLAYYAPMNGCRWSNKGETVKEGDAWVCGQSGGGGGGGGGSGGGDPGLPGGSVVTVCGPNGAEDVYSPAMQRAYSTATSSSKPSCEQVRATIISNNPCFLGAAAKHDYISEVADNIVRVTRFGTIEVESLYEPDPYSPNYDRVLTQRYGGLDTSAYGQAHTVAADLWDSNYPEYSFDYIMTRPIVTGGTLSDATEGNLPSALLDTYPLETLNLKKPWHPVDACHHAYRQDPTQNLSGVCKGVDERTNDYKPLCGQDYELVNRDTAWCNPNRQIGLQLQLPGAFETHPWADFHDPNPDPAHPKLYRSRMTCNQIAMRYSSDAEHNGVIQTLVTPASGSKYWERIEGSRQALQNDHRRICIWVKVTDRDKDTKYIGMNFRGQPLVEAVQGQDDDFLISETLYNADGMTIERRNTRPSTRAWAKADGFTTRTYAEIDPAAHNGMNDWIPQWWMRRFNLTQERVYPRTAGTQGASTYTWSPHSQTNTLTKKNVAWKGTLFEYEPMFNQVRRVETKVQYANAPEDSQVVVLDYDYQELDPGGSIFLDALRDEQKWSLRLPQNFNLDANWVKKVHVPVKFYQADLNGDGRSGFSNHMGATGPKRLAARGFPVRITWFGRNSSVIKKVRHIEPAPHGLPAQILFEDGRHLAFSYYPSDHDLTTSPSPAKMSGQFRGLLAKAAWKRHDSEALPLTEGPGDHPLYAASNNPSLTPCTQLHPAFQWMLKSGCGSGAATKLATALGVSAEVAAELVKSAANPKTEESVFTYNSLGHIHTVRKPKTTGQDRVWTMQKDTDGLLYKETDPSGHYTLIARNADGWVTKHERFDSDGTLVRRSLYQHDAEGHVLTQCDDVNPGTASSCSTLLTTRVAYDAPRAKNNPDFLLTTSRYTAEGLILKTRDPYGVDSIYERDERGLVTSQTVREPGSSEEPRHQSFEHDIDGQVTRIIHGTSATRQLHGPKDETFKYDAFGHVTEYVDSLGGVYLTAYDGFGQVTSRRDSAESYAANLGLKAHEQRFAYDAFGALKTERDQEGNLTTVAYNSRHLPRRVDTRQGGTATAKSVWMTYDAMGELAWTIDALGNQHVMAYNPLSQKEVSADITAEQVRNGERGPTVSTVTAYDLSGYPQLERRQGSLGEVQDISTSHNAAGDLIALTNPEQQTTFTDYNLVGWPIETQEPSDATPLASIMTTRQYNAHGQTISLSEPIAGHTTTYQYNGHGELVARRLPRASSQSKHEEMKHDGYGRLASHKAYGLGDQLVEHLRWAYPTQASGARAQIHWENAPGGSKLMLQRSHDAYGRLISSEKRGLKQAALLGQASPTRVQTFYAYDTADRLTSLAHTIDQGTQSQSYQVNYTHTLASSGWQVTTRYPGADNFTLKTEQDELGRLKKLTQSGGAIPWVKPMEFGWAGGLYTGRTQAFAPELGTPDPMREIRSFDGLGRLRRHEYRAVEFDPNQTTPKSPQWAGLYCLGQWRSECASALWSSDFKYDVMGRVASLDQKARHPLWQDSSRTQLRPEAQRRHDWRGYGYNARSFLTKEYRSEGSQTAAHQNLANHTVTTANLETLIQAPATPGTRWDWNRDEQSGDLNSIAQAGVPANTLWKHVNPANANHRRTGHELVSVSLDGMPAAPIAHDDRGRISSDTHHDYAWDALDRLVASKPKGATAWEEIHYYDAQGRLLLTQRPGGPTERFVYDGLQKVALYDAQHQLQWRAVWGPGLDDLVWWHDVAGGHSYIPLTDGQKSVVGLWHEQQGKLAHLRSFDARGQVTTWQMETETPRCQESAASGLPCELDLADSPTRFGFGWHSAWRSATTGLVQMRQRWYSPKLGQFLSHDPLEYLDSHNLYAFGARDPVNGWDPMGLGTQGFANEFLEGVKKGASREANRQLGEVSKTAESLKQTAKELGENWRFGLDPKVWKDALGEMGASSKEMAEGMLDGGAQCLANPQGCLTQSEVAKRLGAMKEDYDRGDMRALGEKTGEVLVEAGAEIVEAAATKGAGKAAKVVKKVSGNRVKTPDDYKSQLFERKGKLKSQSSLKGAQKELKEGVKDFDHVTKVRQAQNGLMKIINDIKEELRGKISPERREMLEKELSQASRLLDHSERYVPREKKKK